MIEECLSASMFDGAGRGFCPSEFPFPIVTGLGLTNYRGGGGEKYKEQKITGEGYKTKVRLGV